MTPNALDRRTHKLENRKTVGRTLRECQNGNESVLSNPPAASFPIREPPGKRRHGEGGGETVAKKYGNSICVIRIAISRWCGRGENLARTLPAQREKVTNSRWNKNEPLWSIFARLLFSLSGGHGNKNFHRHLQTYLGAGSQWCRGDKSFLV